LAGFGKKTGIDLPNESEGLMPSPSWKLRSQREKWYAGETISVAIGQGAIMATPIQLASIYGGRAGGGVVPPPHLVKGAEEAPRKIDLRPETLATVISGLCGVVNEGGTGAPAQIPGIEVCGKTGTAQRASADALKLAKAAGHEMKDNSWFVGFAP